MSLAIAAVVGLVLAAALWMALDRWERERKLTEKVRDLISTDTRYRLETDDAARELRALVALDGHRMPKHARDAANVWLAEHDRGAS